MAKEEYTQQWSKTGEKLTIRNRKRVPNSKDKNTQHLSKDDTQSSNGTSAQQFSKGETSDGPSEVVLQMLVMGLSFSTRFYRITEPPHVWWVKSISTQCPLQLCTHNHISQDYYHLPSVIMLFTYSCLVLQLGWDTLWKDGELLHQQDLLFWCPSSTWKSEKSTNMNIAMVSSVFSVLMSMIIICCRCWLVLLATWLVTMARFLSSSQEINMNTTTTGAWEEYVTIHIKICTFLTAWQYI